jgi:hypothetical protein
MSAPVEAPSRPLEDDELEALIEEARRRARRRRFGYAAVLVFAALLGGGLYLGFHGNGGRVTPSDGKSRAAAGGAPRCRSAALRLSSTELVPMTGETGGIFLLANRSPTKCIIEGYPRVQLIVRGRPLPFRYKNGGGPYVTTRRPQAIVMAPRARAYFLVAKYRCDAGPASPSASEIRVAPPRTSGSLALRVPSGLEYCQASRHEEQRLDPGNTVVVSPVAASRLALIRR